MRQKFNKAGSLLFQILILLVIFTVAFIFLARAKLIQLPSFMDNLIHNESDSTVENNNSGSDIFKYIGDVPDTPEEFKSYPEITSDNLNVLLNSLKPYTNFYWESISETYSSGSSVIKDCKSRISGNKYNVEISDKNGNISAKYISNGEKTAVTKYNGTASESAVYSAGIFDFYSDAGIISADYFRDFDFSGGNCTVRLAETDSYRLVYVEYSYIRNGVTVKNEYGISLDYGVVLFARCFENDTLVFSQKTTSVYPLDSLDDKLFTVN